MIFVALETFLKIDEFTYDFGVIPDPESRSGWGELGVFLGAQNH